MIRVFNQYVSQKSICLVLWEGLLIGLCISLAAKIRFWNEPETFASFTAWPGFGLQLLVTIAVFQACFYYNDLYNSQAASTRQEQAIRLWQALGAACLVCGCLYFLVPSIEIGRGVFFISVLLLAGATMLSRMTLDFTWPRTAPRQNVLILGTGPLALTVAREFSLRQNDLNVHVVGLVEKNGSGAHPTINSMSGLAVLGGVDSLQKIASEHRVHRIVVALEDQRGALPARDLVNLRVRGIPVEEASTTLAALTGRIWLSTARPSWFLYSEGFRRSKLTLTLKRFLDLVFGLAGLILSAPLMVLVAIAIRLDSPGPVLYRQQRVGLGGKIFEVLKFRSMKVGAESNGAQWALKNDPRVTRLGRILRKYRLDELPQFINVIRGDMSFVGPRPERPVFVEQLQKVIPYYDVRHSVRPGLTGWAQVRYRYGSSVEESAQKLEYDLFYLKNLSLSFDCAIVFQTVRIVLFGHGAR